MSVNAIDNDFLKTITDYSISKRKVEDISFKEMYNKIKNEENKKEEIEKAGEEFESYFTYKILKDMYDSIPRSELSSNVSGQYRDMLIDAYSKEMAKNGGLGIKQMIVNQLSKENET